MAQAACAKKLEVTLGGIIAYVPDENALWALMPDASVPTPARWRPMEKLMAARSTHLPFLIVEEAVIDYGKTTGEIDAFFRGGYNVSTGSAHRPPEQAAILLLGEQIEFKVPEGELKISPKVKEFVPQMSEISPKHKYADKRFNPRLRPCNTDIPGLAAAFEMKVGELRVEHYFDEINGCPEVDFGFVGSSFFGGSPKYSKIVWQKKIANVLKWTVPLPDHYTEVVLTSTNWRPESSSDYVLKIPESGTLSVGIMHAEPDVPTLFQPDPILSEEVAKMPDPDFEVLYSLSSETRRSLRWRVPVPPGGGGGTETKPCAGGFFERFK